MLALSRWIISEREIPSEKKKKRDIYDQFHYFFYMLSWPIRFNWSVRGSLSLLIPQVIIFPWIVLYQRFHAEFQWHPILVWNIYSKWFILSKFISLNLPTMPEKHLPSAVKTEILNYTSPGRNRFKNTPHDFPLPYSFHLAIEMKTLGNHIARFKNIYLWKLTKCKIHGAFTCLLTVCKSVSHGWLLP